MARILLVDDDSQLLSILKTVLNLEGHEVFLASDGVEALHLIDAGPFDVVLTDLIMPDKEGLEMIQEIRAGRPDLKIIAMTGGGYGSAATYLSWARAFGVQQTLMKPFSREELLVAIRELLIDDSPGNAEGRANVE